MPTFLKNIPVGKVILEMTSIVFAVLVALWLDQWQEERKEQALAEQFTSRINTEIATNFRELREALEANTAMQDSLGRLSAGANTNTTLLQQMASINFSYSTPDVSDAVWTSAGLTGSIPLLNVSQVEDLASIYRSATLLNDYSRHLIERLGELLSIINGPDATNNNLTELLYSFSIANQITDQLQEECHAYLALWAPELLAPSQSVEEADNAQASNGSDQ